MLLVHPINLLQRAITAYIQLWLYRRNRLPMLQILPLVIKTLCQVHLFVFGTSHNKIGILPFLSKILLFPKIIFLL